MVVVLVRYRVGSYSCALDPSCNHKHIPLHCECRLGQGWGTPALTFQVYVKHTVMRRPLQVVGSLTTTLVRIYYVLFIFSLNLDVFLNFQTILVTLLKEVFAIHSNQKYQLNCVETPDQIRIKNLTEIMIIITEAFTRRE